MYTAALCLDLLRKVSLVNWICALFINSKITRNEQSKNNNRNNSMDSIHCTVHAETNGMV